MKTIYILIGLKGSGKTHLGELLSEKMKIPFLRVENIFLKLNTQDPLEDQNYISTGYKNVEIEIRNRLSKDDQLIIESTGIATQLNDMIENLKNDYVVKLIKIDSDPELCLGRIKTRDQSKHISVSDDQILKINKLAGEASFNFDLVIDNNNKENTELLEEFMKLL